MRVRDLWRIAALTALILAALGLALGACMAKKSTDTGQSTATTPGKGGGSEARGAEVQPPPNKPPATPGDSRSSGRDAGTKTQEGPTPPPPAGRPQPGKSVPKGHKGMLGQMRLQGGD